MADESSTSQGGRDAAELTVPRLLGISIGIRLIFDTGVQIFNPFLPLIATGLNISEVMLGSLVGLRSLTGLTSPFFGALGDRRGYRLVMRLGLLLGGSGALIVGLSQAWLLTIVGMLIWGVGIAAFTPSLHAYLSARLPYAQRARGIGILEYSWALAGIVGLYLVGFLIEWQGWRAPFFVLGLLMLISSAIIWLFFSPVDRSEDGNAVIGAETGAEVASQSRPTAPTPLSLSTRINDFFALGENQRSAYANMFGSSLLFFGAIQMMITHGLWLRTEYGLGAVQLGTVALVMGVSDLCGSVGVSLFADRVGNGAASWSVRWVPCLGT